MTARFVVLGLLLSGPVAAQSPPLTLPQAVAEAVSNNLDLAAQRLILPVAEARAITARLRPNPVLTVSGQSLNLLGANFSPNTPLGPNQTNIHTDFPIERGGKRQSRVVLAREQKNLAELEVRELMRQVIVAVHNAFVDVQQAKALLQLAKENLQSLQGVVTINEARLKNGDLAEVELERSRLAALQSQARVEQAQLQLEQAKIQLQLLIGRKQTAPDFEIAGDLRADAPAFHPTQLSELALSRRPDYLLTVQSQATSRADLKLQIANGRVDLWSAASIPTSGPGALAGVRCAYRFLSR